MVRGISIALGIGLVILWLVGLSNHATAWLTWFNGLGALAAFGVAASAPEGIATSRAAGGPFGLSGALFVLWIVAMVTRADHWLAWWTFAFACAFLIVGFLGSSQRTHGGGVHRTRLA
jgi:hypothetical protein